MISYSVRSCVVHVKYCNHLLAADMGGVACRGLWCVCCWKDIGRVWESVKVLWCRLFLVAFWGFYPYSYVFSFLKCFFDICIYK